MASGTVHIMSERFDNNFVDVGLTLLGCTGTIVNTFRYRIYKDIFEFGGTARFNITARTSSNPGAYFYIPGQRQALTSFYIQCGVVGAVNGKVEYEMCRVQVSDNNRQISVTTTESQANLPTGAVKFSLPFIQLALKPL